MLRQVENAVDSGDGDIQIRTLRQRLAASERDLDARILLARIYSQGGLPDLALEHYRLAIAQFPGSPVAALGLAKQLREMGEPTAALKVINEYLATVASLSWELASIKGILQDELGRPDQAESAHRAALTLEPGRSALHNNLGYNLLLQGKSEAAAVEFRRAIEIDPASQLARNNLAAALASEPQSGPAEAVKQLSQSQDPAVAHNNVAAVLIEQGRYDEARAELSKSLEYRRDLPAALANVRLLAEAGLGQVVIVPEAAKPATFWQRVALAWGKVIGSAPEPRTAVSTGAEVDNSAPKSSSGQVGDPSGSAGRK
jgi:Flp pilus assembly protein TadD